MASFLTVLLNVLIVLASIFLICLVLIQRGKGGGLAGAFGGAGGSSAFGTKAGDIFTKITMITALGWILMLMISVIMTNRNGSSAWSDDTSATGGPAGTNAPAMPGGTGNGPGGTGPADIVPPPPTGVPSPVTSPARDLPPVSPAGPSAPLPVSPLPSPAPGPAPSTTAPPATPPAAPATKPAEGPAAPKS